MKTGRSIHWGSSFWVKCRERKRVWVICSTAHRRTRGLRRVSYEDPQNGPEDGIVQSMHALNVGRVLMDSMIIQRNDNTRCWRKYKHKGYPLGVTKANGPKTSLGRTTGPVCLSKSKIMLPPCSLAAISSRLEAGCLYNLMYQPLMSISSPDQRHGKFMHENTGAYIEDW